MATINEIADLLVSKKSIVTQVTAFSHGNEAAADDYTEDRVKISNNGSLIVSCYRHPVLVFISTSGTWAASFRYFIQIRDGVELKWESRIFTTVYKRHFALSGDGSDLYLLTTDGQIRRLDLSNVSSNSSPTAIIVNETNWELIDTTDSGNRIVVARNTDSSAEIRVYDRNTVNNTWSQFGETINTGQACTDISISGDGKRFVIGQPYTSSNSGSAKVYEWDVNNNSWKFEQISGAPGNYLGMKVKISKSGNKIAFSGNFENNIKVQAYSLFNSTWIKEEGAMDAETSTNAYASLSLSGDGNTIAYGSDQAEKTSIYNWNGLSWNHVDDIKPISTDQGKGLSLNYDGTKLVSRFKGGFFLYKTNSSHSILPFLEEKLFFIEAKINNTETKVNGIEGKVTTIDEIKKLFLHGQTELLNTHNFGSSELSEHQTTKTPLEISNDGSTILVGHQDSGHQIMYWNGSNLQTSQYFVSSRTFCLSGDGKYRATLNSDGIIFVNRWNVYDNTWVSESYISTINGFNLLSMSDNGHRIVGVRNAETSAAEVRIFDRNIDGAWSQFGNPISLNTRCKSLSVSGNGNKFVVGLPYTEKTEEDGSTLTLTGSVRLYELNESTNIWDHSQIYGEKTGEFSGWEVKMSRDGSKIAIGEFRRDSSFKAIFTVEVYSVYEKTWSKLENEITITDSNYTIVDYSVSGDGNRLAVSSPLQNRVDIYNWNGSLWVHMNEIHQSVEDGGGYFGKGVALNYDGSKIMIKSTNRLHVYGNNSPSKITPFVESKIFSIEERLDDMLSKINSIETKVNGIEGKVNTNETKLASLENITDDINKGVLFNSFKLNN
jgi:6-phosphogluconolactonase (cycloisomerase 2 family)